MSSAATGMVNDIGLAGEGAFWLIKIRMPLGVAPSTTETVRVASELRTQLGGGFGRRGGQQSFVFLSFRRRVSDHAYHVGLFQTASATSSGGTSKPMYRISRASREIEKPTKGT